MEILTANPNYTIMQVAEEIYGKPVLRRSNEYNSTCRSFQVLEASGLIEREGGQVTWKIKNP